MPNKDIAQFLNLAEDTVKKHLTSIYDKLGVSTRLELDHFAREHKLPTKDLAETDEYVKAIADLKIKPRHADRRKQA